MLALIIWSISSCSSEEEKARKEMEKEVKKTTKLLEEAETKNEIEMNAPMGFMLGTTEEEFQKQLSKVIEEQGAREERGVKYINVTEFGGLVKEVRISNFHYFSDSNTETDIISMISYIFDEFRYESDEKAKLFLDQISEKFDSSWNSTEFKIDYTTDKFKNYRKYWIKNNLAVEFKYSSSGYVSLSYYNIPKHGTIFLNNEVELYMKIYEKIKEEEKNKVQIINSPWDGSVSQVKKFLKKNLKDPDSYESIEWGKVKQIGDVYKVYHKYRAKNSFGGYVVEKHTFTIDFNGNIIDVK